MRKRHDVGRRLGVLFFHGTSRSAPLLLDARLVADGYAQADEAMHYVRARHPYAAIIDHASTGEAGIAFARRLRESGYASPLFILGNGAWHGEDLAAELGATYVDGEHVGAAELANRLATAIEGHHAIGELRDLAHAHPRRARASWSRIATMLGVALIAALLALRGCHAPTTHAARIAKPHASASRAPSPTATATADGRARLAAHANAHANAPPAADAMPPPTVRPLPPLPGPGIPGPQSRGGLLGARGAGADATHGEATAPPLALASPHGISAERAPHPSAQPPAGAAARAAVAVREPTSAASPEPTRERAAGPTLGPIQHPSPASSGRARGNPLPGGLAGARGAQASIGAAAPAYPIGGYPGGAGADATRSLAAAVNAAIGDAARNDTSVAIDDADGNSLFRSNDDVARAPASTVKLVVAAVALAQLGPAFRFTTTLGARRAPSGGTISGDLLIRGDGDPTLTERELRDAVHALRTHGVRRIDGGVVVLTGAFGGPEQNEHWPIADLTFPYAAGSSAVTLDGDVSRGVAVRDVPAFVGRTLTGLLQEGGIVVAHAPRVATDERIGWLAWRHRSAPLAAIVGAMLASSNNLDAEQLLRRIALRDFGSASAEAGIRAETEQLRAWGVSLDGLHLHDGSGLAPGDRATARTLVALLDRIAHGSFAAIFPSLMPRVGIDGTSASRALGFARGRVRAKDGHIGTADALAGYVRSARHGRLSFAILSSSARVSRRELEAMQNRITEILARY